VGDAVKGVQSQGQGVGKEVQGSVQSATDSAKSNVDNLSDTLQRNTGEAMDFLKGKAKATADEGPRSLRSSWVPGAPLLTWVRRQTTLTGAHTSLLITWPRRRASLAPTVGGLSRGVCCSRRRRGGSCKLAQLTNCANGLLSQGTTGLLEHWTTVLLPVPAEGGKGGWGRGGLYSEIGSRQGEARRRVKVFVYWV